MIPEMRIRAAMMSFEDAVKMFATAVKDSIPSMSDVEPYIHHKNIKNEVTCIYGSQIAEAYLAKINSCFADSSIEELETVQRLFVNMNRVYVYFRPKNSFSFDEAINLSKASGCKICLMEIYS
jgi:methanogenic corrinoid protein MtbC1